MIDQRTKNAVGVPDTIAKGEELINYPCDFPIKVMGDVHDDFIKTIVDLITPYDPQFTVENIETRKSTGGRYESLTCNVHATSREQLDNIYRALTAHPYAKYVI